MEDGKEQECPSSNFPAVPSHWLRIDKGEDGQLNGKVDAKWQQLRLSANDSLQRVLSKGELNYNAIASRRRQWHPTPVLLPGKSHGRRSLEGCNPWGR